MPMGYSAPNNQALPSTQQSASGVVTDQVISKEFTISAAGAKSLVIKAVVSGVAHTGTQTLKLQTAIDGDWVDSKTATFTADGNVYIKILAEASADQTYLPLLNSGRLVITQTNSADRSTFATIRVLQED